MHTDMCIMFIDKGQGSTTILHNKKYSSFPLNNDITGSAQQLPGS